MGSGEWSGTRRVRHSPAEGVRVRPAEERDLHQVHSIEVIAFGDPWSLEGFRDTLENPRARMEVADDGNGGVLGYAVAWYVADEAEIANLAVSPAARRRGIGALLLLRILDAAATFGAGEVFLEVRESNEAALALYAAQGFTVVGRRKQYYRRPAEDALIMRRTL